MLEGKGNFAFNAQTGEHGDMVSMGVLDPTKVTRTALQNAASVAGLILTTARANYRSTEKPRFGGAFFSLPGPTGAGGDFARQRGLRCKPTAPTALPDRRQAMPNARISFEFLLAIACAALSMAACNPVALVRPEADKVVVSGSSPPPAKGPVYSIDFDVRGCYQPGTLRVLLNGRDISSRYPCSSGTCGALTTPDDLRYVRNTAKAYVQTVAWTAAGNGNLFCGSANYSYDFLAYGLGYTCTPEDVATGAPGTSFAAMSYASLPSTNRCMMSGHGLGLSVRAGGSTAGTVFVELGVPAPSPNGLEIQILSDGNTDLTINNVAVNGQPPSTVISTVTVPMLDLRTSFTVSVSPARVPLGTTKLIRQITLKAPGFAPTELVVTIAR